MTSESNVVHIPTHEEYFRLFEEQKRLLNMDEGTKAARSELASQLLDSLQRLKFHNNGSKNTHAKFIEKDPTRSVLFEKTRKLINYDRLLTLR